jgi:hypothetical protein
MQNSRIISTLCLVAALVIVMPMGYSANSVQAQLLPSTKSPPSAATTTTTPKVAVAQVTTPTTSLKVDVILYGIDNNTGPVVTFVFAKNHTDAVAFNATDNNIKHENSTGVAEAFFTLPDLKLKVGDKIQACNVSIKDLNLVCGSGLKSPLNRTESVNIMVPGSSTSSNKTKG